MADDDNYSSTDKRDVLLCISTALVTSKYINIMPWMLPIVFGNKSSTRGCLLLNAGMIGKWKKLRISTPGSKDPLHPATKKCQNNGNVTQSIKCYHKHHNSNDIHEIKIKTAFWWHTRGNHNNQVKFLVLPPKNCFEPPLFHYIRSISMTKQL